MPRISKRQALGWINFTRPPNENCNDKKALFRLVFSNVATATALVCLYLASSGPRDNLQAFEENSIFGTSLRGTETSEYVLPKYQNHDWEGIPAEEPGHPLVAKGYVDFIDNAGSLFLEDYLEEFLTVYENRPDKVNLCGMRITTRTRSFWQSRLYSQLVLLRMGSMRVIPLILCGRHLLMSKYMPLIPW